MNITISPIAVRLMLSSWFCRPNFAAASTQTCKQVQGMMGRKSVTTSCKLWNATLIKDSLKIKITISYYSSCITH